MKTIIAFDFDGTLTKRDSFLHFIKFVKGNSFLYFNLCYFVLLWTLFKVKIISRHQSKELIFRKCFKGMSLKTFNRHCELFIFEINKILRKEVTIKIKEHISEGHTPIIISASIKNWILPWAKTNNINLVIATEIEIDKNNILTGKFSTPNCRGIEKTNRLFNIYKNRNDFKLISYGDSTGDNELLENSNEAHWNYFK